MVTPADETRMLGDKINMLQNKLREKQVVTIEEAKVNGVAFSDTAMLTKLGPIVYSKVTVNGVKVTALTDTG